MKTAIIILGTVVGVIALYIFYMSTRTKCSSVGADSVTFFPTVPTDTNSINKQYVSPNQARKDCVAAGGTVSYLNGGGWTCDYAK